MPATRDGKTWRSQFYYEDWQGIRHKKNKRGFKTKAEAEEWERNFRQQQRKDLDINFENFVEIYFADMENRLRESTIKNKRYVFDLKVTPYFKKKKMCEIKNDYNIEIDGQILGLPNDNLALNSKKPYMEHKTRKKTVPYLLTPQNAAVQRMFFDYLMNEANKGNTNLFFDNSVFDAKEGCENEFAIFVETEIDTYLPNLSEYISFEKGDKLNTIDISGVAEILNNIGDRIKDVEVYFNPHTTKLVSGIKGEKLYDIITQKEV